MKKPIYDILLDITDGDEQVSKDKREKLKELSLAEQAKHKTPIFELLVMTMKEEIDAERLRDIFPQAIAGDITALEKNPQDDDAFAKIYATHEEKTFAASLKYLTMRGVIGDPMIVKVKAKTDKGETVIETDDYFVTPGFVTTAKLMALELYKKLLAKHPNIAESESIITVGEQA